MIKNLICISCPRGCHLEVNTETLEVKGNTCPRGKVYGVNEVTAPKRTLTTTVRIEGADINMVSVRTDKPIPKEDMFKAMEVLSHITVKAPVHIGDIVVKDILGTGSDIIITKEVL